MLRRYVLFSLALCSPLFACGGVPDNLEDVGSTVVSAVTSEVQELDTTVAPYDSLPIRDVLSSSAALHDSKLHLKLSHRNWRRILGELSDLSRAAEYDLKNVIRVEVLGNPHEGDIYFTPYQNDNRVEFRETHRALSIIGGLSRLEVLEVGILVPGLYPGEVRVPQPKHSVAADGTTQPTVGSAGEAAAPSQTSNLRAIAEGCPLLRVLKLRLQAVTSDDWNALSGATGLETLDIEVTGRPTVAKTNKDIAKLLKSLPNLTYARVPSTEPAELALSELTARGVALHIQVLLDPLGTEASTAIQGLSDIKSKGDNDLSNIKGLEVEGVHRANITDLLNVQSLTHLQTLSITETEYLPYNTARMEKLLAMYIGVEADVKARAARVGLSTNAALQSIVPALIRLRALALNLADITASTLDAVAPLSTLKTLRLAGRRDVTTKRLNEFYCSLPNTAIDLTDGEPMVDLLLVPGEQPPKYGRSSATSATCVLQ